MIRIVNHWIKKASFGNLINFNRNLASSSFLFSKLNYLNQNSGNKLLNISIAQFAEKKKGGGGEHKKNDKKAKIEKEKESINKEYEDVGVEDLTGKYKSQVEETLTNFKNEINEIKLSRNNPKIFDNLTVLVKSKKLKLGEIATVMIRGTNILVINPYDADQRDAIIKAVETSKLDVQISTEDSNVVVILGAIPQDMKNEYIQNAKKLFESTKEDLKSTRHSVIGEIKKLEKILSKDEAKRIEKSILENIDKALKQIEQSYKKKEEEIKSV